MSIIIITAVAIAIGILVLTLGLCFVKRYYRNRNQELVYRSPNDLHYDATSYGLSTAPHHKYKDAASKQLFSNVDCDGYTHIWEHPLPTPAQSAVSRISSLPCGSSAFSTLQNHNAQRSRDGAPLTGAHGTTQSFGSQLDGDRRPVDSGSDDSRYYQLDFDNVSLSQK